MKRQTGPQSGSENEQLEITGGGSSGGTVDQGSAGTDPWLIEIDPSQLPLPVSASIDTTGLATEAKQDDEITELVAINAKLATKALEGQAFLPGDPGYAAWAVAQYSDIDGPISADGEYSPFLSNSVGRLKTLINPFYIIDSFESLTGWSVFNDDAANLTTDLNHVLGTISFEFDKVNGTANTTYALIQKTITSINIFNLLGGAGFFQGAVNIPNTANVTNVILRMGTDSSNYNEWAVPATGLTAAIWQHVRWSIIESTGFAGNGWNATAVTYIAVGLQFNLQSDLLADILWDGLAAVGGAVTDSVLASSTVVNSANVNLNRVGGNSTSVGAGASNSGTQRVTLPSDDPAVAVLGVTTGAAIITDADGTIQRYLRGLVKLLTTVGGIFFTPTPSATGGWSMFNATSGDGSTALTNSGQSVKNGQGTLGGWYIYNPNTVVAYVCVYNNNSPTVGTTNPSIILTIPPEQAANLEITNGLQFSTAIAVAAVMTTAGGNTAPTIALEANFWYK